MAASPGGREVGRISIRVVPDTSKLVPDLRAALAKVEAKVNLNINTELDTSGLIEHAKVAVKEAEAAAGKVHIETEVDKGSARAAGKGISALLVAGLALGPALVPVLAAILAGVVALAGPLAAAAVGAGAFGAVAIPAFTKITKASSALAKAQLAVTNATTSKQRIAALTKEKQIWAALDPAQRAAVKNLNAFKSTWNKLVTALEPKVFPIIAGGLKLVADMLPSLTPIVSSVAEALGYVLDDLTGAEPYWKRFAKFIAGEAGGAIDTFAGILQGLAQAFGSLLIAFAPLGEKMLIKVLALSDAFAKWAGNVGTSSGFHSFIAYVTKNGPVVASTLANMGKTLGKLVVALAPFGTAMLKGLNGVFGFLGKLSPGQLLAIASGVSALFAAFKITKLVVGIKQASGAFGVLNAVMDANPIGAIILLIAALAAGFIYAYKNSETFRNIVQGVLSWLMGAASTVGAFFSGPFVGFFTEAWSKITGVFNTVVGFIRDHLATIGTILATIMLGPLRLIVALVITNFERIRAAVSAAIGFISGIWSAFWQGPFGQLIQAAINLVVAIVQLGGRLLSLTFDFALGKIRYAVTAAFTAVHLVISTVLTAVMGIVTVACSYIAGVVSRGVALIRSVVSAGFNAVLNVVHAVWGAISPYVSAAVGRVLAAANRVRAVAGIIGGAFSSAYSAATGWIGRLVGAVSGLAGRVAGAVSNFGGLLRGAGQRLIQGLIDGIMSKVRAITGAMNSITSKIKGFLPGSPVKEGPLVSWNNGGAGKRLVGLLADGLSDTTAVDQAMRSMTSRLASAVGPVGLPPTVLSGALAASSGGAGAMVVVNPSPGMNEVAVGYAVARRLSAVGV